MSVSPPLSPLGGTARRPIDRQHSASPPTQLSKRDKRRTMLADRLAEITVSFSQNRDMHYREQLQAIQVDMNLIMEADVHAPTALPNNPAEIDDLVKENIRKTMMKSVGPNPPLRAGRMYSVFAMEVNNAMEERDAALCMHMRDYQVRMADIAATDAYRKRLAEVEHAHLASSLRDRLINSVSSKKGRLARDKDMIEIGESHALLLHPSQFGHVNPSSPGGVHGKRATRNRREAEDVPNFSEGGTGTINKRKRKAADSDESPAPNRQRIDNGNSTPLWLAEKASIQAMQFDTPLYSVEKLFTEKELAMTYNTAAIAANTYILRHQALAAAAAAGEDGDAQGLNGKSDSSSENGKFSAGGILGGDLDTPNNNEDADSTLGGTTMERQPSHLTRSTRGTNSALPLLSSSSLTLSNAPFSTGFNIAAATDLNYPTTMTAFAKLQPKLPPVLAANAVKVYSKGDGANQCVGLTPDEAAAELDLIRRARRYNDERGLGRNLDVDVEGGRGGLRLLGVVSQQKGVSEYKWWVGGGPGEGNGSGSGDAEAGRDGDADGEGENGREMMGMGIGAGSAMSKQSSRGGGDLFFGDMGMGMGGVAMSRQGTGDGVTSSRGRTIKPRREV